MKTNPTVLPVLLAAIALTALIVGLETIAFRSAHGQAPHTTKPAAKPTIPRTWDDAAIPALEVPLAHPIGSPKHISADYYYRIPVRPIYKQYPVYAPGREPAGYIDWLKRQDPIILWDDGNHKPKLETEADWVKAGEDVFSAPLFTDASDQAVIAITDIKATTWYQKRRKIPISKDGVLPFVHYVIREKGKIELGSFSCAMCHTRVMPDGTMLKGAQGNFPFERSGKYSPRPSLPAPLLHAFNQGLYAAPWLHPLIQWTAKTSMSSEETQRGPADHPAWSNLHAIARATSIPSRFPRPHRRLQRLPLSRSHRPPAAKLTRRSYALRRAQSGRRHARKL